MKKYFLFLAGFVLLMFTACQNDELANGGKGGEVSASFSVQLPKEGNSAVTRTTGDGATVNRCILEVYLNDELYKREAVAISELKAKFNVRLVTSQTYKFVFWADYVASSSDLTTDGHYNTKNGLGNIAMMGDYEGSSKDDTRDAFFAMEEKLVTGAFAKSIELSRPFGQLNIKTTDLNNIPNIQNTDLIPATATLSFKDVYTGFNAITGKATGERVALSYKSAANVVDADGNLTVDYLFAPEATTVDGKANQLLANMTLTVFSASGTLITTKELNTIPIQRNYKTNVKGNLLTAESNITATVVPAFETDELDYTIAEAATAEEVSEKLKTNSNVVLTETPKTATTISMPKYAKKNVAVSITLPQTTEPVTFSYETSTGEGGETTYTPKK
ncbi:MAG: hypothetical protein LUE99_10490 [Bacteroides sp.]|nr:hypothetical protein [Bacteroides sp.]